MMQLSELRNKHEGETVWVLGSGPSLNFLAPEFFDNKTVVATNFSARVLGIKPDYVFSHYHEIALDLLTDYGVVVTLAKNWRDGSPFPDADNARTVLVELDSYRPPGEAWNPLTTHKPCKDSLVFGSSSFHGAMHLAAHLGAAHIVLVGGDCGTIDSQHYVKGYDDTNTSSQNWIAWKLYNKHHKLMKDYLVQECGVQVYSLNPFINFNLEGHTFHGA